MTKQRLTAWVYNKNHLGAMEMVDVFSLEDSSAARVSGTVVSIAEAVELLQSVADVTRVSNSDLTAVRIDEGVVTLLVVETADYLMVVK